MIAAASTLEPATYSARASMLTSPPRPCPKFRVVSSIYCLPTLSLSPVAPQPRRIRKSTYGAKSI